MSTVQSRDGTTIAFDRSGEGPPIILVGGALQHRAMDPETAQLAALLAQNFTVFHYDRRGRGDSGDTPPYAVEREVEDIEALIDEAGGSASLYGMSSGGALALEAAARRGLAITKLALNDLTIMGDDSLLTERVPSVAVPTLVIDGGASPTWMHNAADAVANALPNAQRRTLEGQTHEVAPGALAPVLEEFFAGVRVA